MGLQDTVVLLVVTICGLTDIFGGKVPNLVTYPAWGLGLLLALALGGWAGIVDSSLGFLVGFVPLFILYVKGQVGGGDVKLMAAVGAIKGYPFVLNALITAILVGGLLGLLVVIWEGKVVAMLRFLGVSIGRLFYRGLEPVALEIERPLPFGAAIALGTYVTLAAELMGHSNPAELL